MIKIQPFYETNPRITDDGNPKLIGGYMYREGTKTWITADEVVYWSQFLKCRTSSGEDTSIVNNYDNGAINNVTNITENNTTPAEPGNMVALSGLTSNASQSIDTINPPSDATHFMISPTGGQDLLFTIDGTDPVRTGQIVGVEVEGSGNQNRNTPIYPLAEGQPVKVLRRFGDGLTDYYIQFFKQP